MRKLEQIVSRRGRFVLAAIIVLAVLLRLIYSFVVFPSVQDGLGWERKGDGYEDLARSLYLGQGFRRAPDRPEKVIADPFYPYLMAAMYSVFGYRPWIPLLFQCLLGGISCCLIFKIGSRLLSVMDGLLAALCWAVYPLAIKYQALFNTETLYIVLLLSFAYSFLAFIEGMEKPFQFISSRVSDFKWAAVAGVLLGVATLTRSVSTYLSLFMMPFLLWRFRKNLGRFLPAYLAFVVIFYLVLTPWKLSFAASRGGGYLSTSGQFVLWYGAHYSMDEEYRDMTLEEAKEVLKKKTWEILGEKGFKDHGEWGQYLEEEALGHIWENKLAFLQGLVRKFGYLWYLAGTPRESIIAGMINIPPLILAVLGIAVAKLKGGKIHLLLLIPAYFVLLHTLTWAMFRYSAPIMPFVFIFASYFISFPLKDSSEEEAAIICDVCDKIDSNRNTDVQE